MTPTGHLLDLGVIYSCGVHCQRDSGEKMSFHFGDIRLEMQVSYQSKDRI